MYDEKSLYNELNSAGFSNIKKCEFGDTNLEIFYEVESEDRFYYDSKESKEIAFHCIK